ncbi:MAG: arsenate reductase [bacterium]|nr:arsenate reductase [bacterium]MDE0669570.1 arsenate reductase [bacterium]
MAERGVEFDVVHYLKEPLDRAGLEALLAILENEPSELVRRDKLFSDLGLTDEDAATPAQVVELLAARPRLMQRPVVVRGGRAIIARPPKTVLELL